MKSYDEITASVLQAAELRTIRIKRMRNACTLTAACLACAIGGAAFMKMEMPTFLPEDPYEAQTDSFHSASDPSTELPTETTAETTVPPTETTTTTTVVTTTTAMTTQTILATSAPAYTAEIITTYVNTEPAAIITSIPGETHTSLTTKQTTTSTFRTTETTESTTSGTTTTETTDATDPIETTESAAPTETATEVIATVPAGTTETSIAPTDAETTETTADALPEISKPANLSDEEWQLLYDMYLRGELPFTFEFLKLPVEDATETTTESLFPFPIT